MIRSFFLALISALVASGCTSLPKFDKSDDVTPGAIIDIIHCELVEAKKKFPRLDGAENEDWIAIAELILQVDEQATLTPAFTHTFVPVFDWGLKLDTQATRVYTQYVEYVLPKLKETKCKDDINKNGRLLTGKLGLNEVVGMAFESIELGPKDEGLSLKTSQKTSGSFGSTIKFVISRNTNGTGPTWTLTNFKGPGKLFMAQRTDTNTLNISFAGTMRNRNGVSDLKKARDRAFDSIRTLQLNNIQLRPQ